MYISVNRKLIFIIFSKWILNPKRLRHSTKGIPLMPIITVISIVLEVVDSIIRNEAEITLLGIKRSNYHDMRLPGGRNLTSIYFSPLLYL